MLDDVFKSARRSAERPTELSRREGGRAPLKG
jgi:hypothetical protein